MLSFLLAVDRALSELLLARAEQETLESVTAKQREDAEALRQRAAAEGAALHLIDYLSMGARFTALRKLGLHERLKLGSRDDRKVLLDVRNQAAHHGVADPDQALDALERAEWMLKRLANALANGGPPAGRDG